MSVPPAPPILVTGGIRSGTTWVGRMIASHPRVAFLAEPFNVRRPPSPVRHFFPYVTEAEQERFHVYVDGVLSHRNPAVYQVAGSWSRPLRVLARRLRCRWWHFRGYRPLVKDPAALFSSEWLARTFGFQVVLLSRHPAAFVSSLKRLGWAIRLQGLARPASA